MRTKIKQGDEGKNISGAINDETIFVCWFVLIHFQYQFCRLLFSLPSTSLSKTGFLFLLSPENKFSSTHSTTILSKKKKTKKKRTTKKITTSSE